MSLFSYQQGLSQGNAESIVAIRERNAAVRDASEAIAEWKAYSSKLEGRLAEAETQVARNAAREAARDAQQRALREALTKIDPHHPLLKALPEIGNSAMAKSFHEHGYHYDIKTETLRKL